MRVKGASYRTIWRDGAAVKLIDQRHLPHSFVVVEVTTVSDMATAIKDMWVRGAGLIGAAAAFGMALAASEAYLSDDIMAAMEGAGEVLKSTRPTAVNLERAVNLVLDAVRQNGPGVQTVESAWKVAQQIADEDAEFCRCIGEHGAGILREIAARKAQGTRLNILTHCNAGWLAFVDHGSATAPIYAAFDSGVQLHVYVDETRPRNQGASLTAWELGQHGVPHTVIADNTGGHLMQHGLVDVVITGADRVTGGGDVCNKIGTYLKALAAKDNAVPFYVALPSSTLDLRITDGVREIPIEERGAREVTHIQGLEEQSGRVFEVRLTPDCSPAANYAFDVTPARLVTGLITERGVLEASAESISSAFVTTA